MRDMERNIGESLPEMRIRIGYSISLLMILNSFMTR